MTCFMAKLPGDSIHNPTEPTHFMWLQPVARRVSVYHENLVLAVTTKALRVIEVGGHVRAPVLYLPKGDVCAELNANGKTTHCPLKGDAVSLDLLDASGQPIITDAAWTYQAPLEIAVALTARIAFDRAHFAIEEAPL